MEVGNPLHGVMSEEDKSLQEKIKEFLGDTAEDERQRGRQGRSEFYDGGIIQFAIDQKMHDKDVTDIYLAYNDAKVAAGEAEFEATRAMMEEGGGAAKPSFASATKGAASAAAGAVGAKMASAGKMAAAMKSRPPIELINSEGKNVVWLYTGDEDVVTDIPQFTIKTAASSWKGSWDAGSINTVVFMDFPTEIGTTINNPATAGTCDTTIERLPDNSFKVTCTIPDNRIKEGTTTIQVCANIPNKRGPCVKGTFNLTMGGGGLRSKTLKKKTKKKSKKRKSKKRKSKKRKSKKRRH